MESKQACRVCGYEDGNTSHAAREMMIGLREPFEYIECAACGCLQLQTVPESLARYYGDGYYSLQEQHAGAGWLRGLLKRRRAHYGLSGKGMLGRFVARRTGLPNHYEWFRRAGVTLESRILDVGSGSGSYLLKLREEGFCHLAGIDPFIERDLIYPNGVKVLKRHLADVNEEFDFVMLNHSFEHMAEPLEVVKKLRAIVPPGGFVLIGIPLADSYAWRRYGVHWVQLDAPRHFFLHTKRSMALLTEQAGLAISAIIYDSTEFQFLGSEQYARDIPLHDARSYLHNPTTPLFTPQDVERFRAKAHTLNEQQQGDQACFLLQKPVES